MIKSYQLNSLFTNEIRFFIMTILAMYEEVDFNFLKKELEATDGNLSIQVKKLEENGYLTVKKEFVNRKPHTSYQITKIGLSELKNYLSVIEKLKKAVEKKE